MSLLGGLGKPKKDKIELSDTRMCIESVLNAYSNALNEHVNSKYAFRVISDLPYSKVLIKDALISFLMVVADPAVRDKIKSCIIELGLWQEHLDRNVERIDTASNIDKLSKAYELYVKCVNCYQAEAEKTKNELSSLGLW